MHFKISLGLLILAVSLFVNLSAYAQSGISGRPAKAVSRSYGRTGLLFDAGIYFGQTEATANPAALNQWQSTTSIYDVRLGYITESSIYFGAEYSTRSDNQISSESASGNAAGLGFGFFSDNGFNIRTFYRFNENYGSYANGTGYKADIGYTINMTSNFFLGFAISIRQTTFKTNDMIVAFDSWTRKETYPFFTFGFLFN